MVFIAMVSTLFIGQHTMVSMALAACVITAIFHPLQLKVHTFVNRYLFRDWAERGDVVREVAAGFSHELKSPLAGLSMQAQLTLQQLEMYEKDPRSFHEAVPRIKEELHYLMNKAMDAARRIEAVRGVAEPSRGQIEAVYIPVVLDRSLQLLDALVADVQAEVKRDLPGNLPPVSSNPQQLEIVFINLMKNALESMEGAAARSLATLSLSAIELNGFVKISVKDTGAGITEKDLAHIFNPTFTTKGRKGTGMGLFLSQQIVKSHGGTLIVRSEVGKGTEFVVCLPKYANGVGEAA
jgi:signal transduction histidine kinase